jgi:serine protease Do
MKKGIGMAVLIFLVAAAARGGPALEALEKEISEIVDRAAPAVVSVITEPLSYSWPGFPEEMQPPEWARRFFREGPTAQKRRSRGSGFLIDPSGYILTTAAVLEGAREVEVNFPGGDSLPARVVGKDPLCNLALLKVEGAGLPHLPLGNPAPPLRGSWAIAIGNPFGLAVSPSWGIVSGLKRSGLGTAEYEDLIQITAPINPGDSGGPLLNSRGEVIGVLTATLSGYREFELDWPFLRRFQSSFPGGGGEYQGDVFQPSLAQGIGFAIPVELAREVTERLKQAPSAGRGWLGIRMRAALPGPAAGPGARGGVVVEETAAGGPAARAGLQAGDLIISLNKKEISTPMDLQREVMNAPPGKEVVLEVIRDKEKIALLVVIAAAPSVPAGVNPFASATQTEQE